MQDWAFLQSGCFFRHTSDRFYVISFESLVGLLYDKCLDTSLIFCNNTFLRNQENTDVCNFLDGFLLQTKLICLEKSLFFLLLLCICHFVCLYLPFCLFIFSYMQLSVFPDSMSPKIDMKINITCVARTSQHHFVAWKNSLKK